MKEKWIFDYTKRPDVDVLEQTQSDLTDALDMLEELLRDGGGYQLDTKIERFLTQFRKNHDT